MNKANDKFWFIKSKDIKDYLISNKIKFSDSEIASLIYNAADEFARGEEELGEIAKNTEDSLLKRQIEERLAYEKAIYKVFSTPAENAIYVLEMYEGEEFGYEQTGFFSNLQAAIEYANVQEGKYMINKRRVLDKCEEEHKVFSRDELGHASYSADGTLRYCSSNEIDEKQYLNGMDDERFEYAYVFVPHPFRTGDIVRISGTEGVGVVVSPKDDETLYWNEENRKIKNWCDYTDITLGVEFLCDDGDFTFDYTPLLNIEYANLKEDDPEKAIMEEAAELMKGNGSIRCLLYEYEKYKKKKGGL